jgi:hypothetical protein
VRRGHEVCGYDCGGRLGRRMYPRASFYSRHPEEPGQQPFHLHRVNFRRFLKQAKVAVSIFEDTGKQYSWYRYLLLKDSACFFTAVFIVVMNPIKFVVIVVFIVKVGAWAVNSAITGIFI